MKWSSFFLTKLFNTIDFRNLDRDIETNAKRWKKFVEAECPEKVKD